MTESQFALLAYMRVLSHIYCKNLLKLLLHLYIIIKKNSSCEEFSANAKSD